MFDILRKSSLLKIACLTLIAVALIASEVEQRPLGEIDFFGYKGLDVATIRAALPFHEGELFPPAKAKSPDDLKRAVSERIRQTIGRDPTDVGFTCCDAKQNWMVYIGLPGESYQAIAFNPLPEREIRLPKAAVALGRQMDEAWMRAVMGGHATEDDSEGYALTNDPRARKAELAIREYALRNEALILQVLKSSREPQDRSIAAQMLGYGRQSKEQIDSLVQASLDPDGAVRNDSIRALEVLAGAKPNLVRMIPIDPFIRLLHSGQWSDHNKGSLLLMNLTKTRDPAVLERLLKEALDPLLEMAQWRYSGHAEPALLILGRIAGIDEDTLNKLIETNHPEAIIGKLSQIRGTAY